MKPLIVYQAPWSWTFLWNRSQPLASALSAQATVLYLNSDVDNPRSLITRALGRVPVVGPWATRKLFRNYIERLSDTLLVYHWRSWSGGYSVSTQDHPAASYERLASEIKRLAARHSETWLLTSRPAARKLVNLHRWDRLIVDIEDPWLELTWGKMIPRRAVTDLLSAATTVFANGPVIARDYSGIASREVLSLPNGIDTSFLKRLDQQQMLPTYFGDSLETRIVYTGNINNRIDFGMLLSVVKSCPRAKFYFFGRTEPSELDPETWSTLLRLDNFRYIPPVPHSSVPAILSHASALLLPYSNWGSQAMFPAKLYEYISSGKPIISTLDFDLGPVRPPTFRVCPRGNDIIDAINDVVDKRWRVSSIDRDVCRRLAEANTWEGRAKYFRDAVARVQKPGPLALHEARRASHEY